jgi:hypothetical protein
MCVCGFAKCVLLLQMAHAEDVEDLGGLDDAPPEAVEVHPCNTPGVTLARATLALEAVFTRVKT